MSFPGECPTGSKLTNSKDRLSLLLCCNMDGTEKLKPALVGKAARPQAMRMKGVKFKHLGVNYYNNSKGWMTGAIFAHWLSQWNEQLHRQKRKVLLLIDNAPGHVCDEYDNIEIIFLPPNTTSKLQPLDQGIISWVKRQY